VGVDTAITVIIIVMMIARIIVREGSRRVVDLAIKGLRLPIPRRLIQILALALEPRLRGILFSIPVPILFDSIVCG
jgi:hypothetical protein